MLTEITLGQYYPGSSPIHHLDPRTKILGVLFYMVMVFLASDPLGYGLLIAFLVLAAGLAKLPPGLLLKSIKPLWVIILLTLLIHFFTDPGEVLWHWKFLSLTKEGIIMGVKMSLRLVLLLLVSRPWSCPTLRSGWICLKACCGPSAALACPPMNLP